MPRRLQTDEAPRQKVHPMHFAASGRLRLSPKLDKPSGMVRLRATIWKKAMSVLCALALVGVTFVHRPVDPQDRMPGAEIAAYLALGGSLADLCLTDGTGGDGASAADCASCTLAKALALAPAALVVSADGVCAAAPLPAAGHPVLAGHAPRAPPARGPPSFHLI